MKPYIRPRRAMLPALVLSCVLLLAGCNTAAGNHAYKIIYSEDISIGDAMDFEQPHPIFQSEMMVYSTYSKEDGATLYVQDADGNDVFTFHDVAGSSANRGMVDGNVLWLTAELWGKPPFGRYVDTALEKSQIIAVDLDTGETTLDETIKEDDLFLFAKDGYCYFYDQGNIPNSVKASIHYRHIGNWDEMVQIHQFDYAGRPDEADTPHTLEFHLLPDGISVVLDLRYENDQREWTNRTVWSVDVPFATP